MRLSSSGLVLAALVASGCQEAPSYAVRWRISPRLGEDLPQTPEPQDEEMTNPSVCARSGVSQVEVRIYDEVGRLVDLQVRPCFPERFRRSGGAVRGARLAAGEYTALVVGTRATRAPWGECPEYPDGILDDDGDSGVLPTGDGMTDSADGGDSTGGDGSGGDTTGADTPPPATTDTPDETTTGLSTSDDTDTDTTGADERPVCTGADVRGFIAVAQELDIDLCVDGTCNPELGLESCDCQTFTVSPDSLTRLPDFSLEAPPDCEDGIDGDEDGLVDQLDPGCQLGSSESTPVLQPEITLALSVLSGNPEADCDNIGVGTLELSIDGQSLPPILCRVGNVRFSTELAIGPHTLEVTGVRSGAGDLAPVTEPKVLQFEVTDLGVTDPPELEIDFADVDLLEPLESSARFTFELQLPDDTESVLCSDEAVGATDYRFRLLDLAGQPIMPAPLSTLGVRLNGTSVPCSPSTITTVQPLSWGGYLLEAEAYNADGDLCWSNADNPAPLVPQEAVGVVALPVEGAPDSCFGG